MSMMGTEPSPFAPTQSVEHVIGALQITTGRIRIPDVGTSAVTQILNQCPNRRSATVRNWGFLPVFIGGRNVTDQDGFPLDLFEALTVELRGELWACTSADADGIAEVRIIAEYEGIPC